MFHLYHTEVYKLTQLNRIMILALYARSNYFMIFSENLLFLLMRVEISYIKSFTHIIKIDKKNRDFYDMGSTVLVN